MCLRERRIHTQRLFELIARLVQPALIGIQIRQVGMRLRVDGACLDGRLIMLCRVRRRPCLHQKVGQREVRLRKPGGSLDRRLVCRARVLRPGCGLERLPQVVSRLYQRWILRCRLAKRIDGLLHGAFRQIAFA